MLERLPSYGVFDYIVFRVNGGTVYLAGYSFDGRLQADAEMAAKRANGVIEVGNKIEVLPTSQNDDRIRWATYYRIYTDDFLSRYAPGGVFGVLQELRDEQHFPGMQPVGRYPIHIIVKNGRTMLLGVVDNASDRQLAEVHAREVTGVFEVEQPDRGSRSRRRIRQVTQVHLRLANRMQTPIEESEHRRTVMSTFRRPTRREVLATGAAAIATSLLPRQPATAAEAASGGVPTGPGSVLGAPNLPAGFANTFASRYVDANGVRLHAVIGGKGRPLLLVHGWPQTWYQWRLVMPALAHDFEVIAVNERGIGLSDKPESGYDARRAGERHGRSDGGARPSALRHGWLRHRHADRLRLGRGSPRVGSNVWSLARPSLQASLPHRRCWCRAH